jgi:uncharacterized protein
MIKGTGLRTAPLLVLLLSLFLGVLAHAQNPPPKPTRYVTDQAGVLDAGTANAINSQLEQFEKDTSNQILVAIYPSLPDDAEVAQYSIDTYNAWGVGQKGKDNGAVLFVFVNSHKMFIATGRGLEGALPDAICKRIVTQEIGPQFKQGKYAAGIQAGVNAMIAASKGEYTGTGTTVDEQNQQKQATENEVVGIIIFLVILFICIKFGGSGGGGPFIFTSGGFGGGSNYGGGGFGGGGFSGGGGSSGGGGAGGGW